MLAERSSQPAAVLKPPVVLLESAMLPMPVLSAPLVLLASAPSPSAVLPLGYPPSGGGLTALAAGESANHASARPSGMRRKPRCNGEVLIKFLSDGIVFVS